MTIRINHHFFIVREHAAPLALNFGMQDSISVGVVNGQVILRYGFE